MDHLTDLLNHAASADTPAGDQRVQEIIGKLRDTEDVDFGALETTAQEKFEELHNGGEYDPDQVTNLEALADIVDAVRNLSAEQRRVQEERDQKVNALADRVRTAPEEEDTSEGEEGDEQPSEDDPDGDEPESTPEEPTAEPEEDGKTTSPAPAETSQRQSEPAKQPVAASGGSRPSTASAVSATRTTKNPAPREEKKALRSYNITAAAEVPDTPFGKRLSQSELAEAALNRYATFPEGQPTNGPIKANVGRINRQFDDQYRMVGSEMTDADTIDSLANETRLPGGSLIAAAGKNVKAAEQEPSVSNDVWCSVSETDWTLCPPMATTTGMLDLPTSAMPRRGGLRYPVWSQYPDEAQDTWHGEVIDYPNNPPKPDGKGLDDPNYFHTNPKKCLTGPCVKWAEVRQSISYLCVTSDILRDRTFPELTERFISDVLVKHQHYLNEHYIKHLYDHSDQVAPFDVSKSLNSTAEAVLDYIPQLVTWFRNAYRMADGSTLEIVAPMWFREFLKRDIERKQNRPHGMVTDAEVQALFASYASRVQWVYDWQDLATDTAKGNVSGKVMPKMGWPYSVELLAYPAGSWVLFQGNILNLGVQYDYQLLQTNEYSAMFTEDSWMLLNRCDRSFKLKIDGLCASGAVPQPSTVVCSEKPPDPEPPKGSETAQDQQKSGGQKKQQ